MSLQLESQQTGQMTAAPPRAGLDLNAHLATHSGDMALMLLIATAITLGHWRYWFYPDDMTLPDGKTRHPLAGMLNCKRVVGDFLFMPTGVVLGVLVLGFSLNLAQACAVVAFAAFAGSALIMTIFEKARDRTLGMMLIEQTPEKIGEPSGGFGRVSGDVPGDVTRIATPGGGSPAGSLVSQALGWTAPQKET